jgi:hypothetical protein
VAQVTPTADRLATYLELERLMLAAEGVDEDVANALRDAMDSIWLALTDQDIVWLDQRRAAREGAG